MVETYCFVLSIGVIIIIISSCIVVFVVVVVVVVVVIQQFDGVNALQSPIFIRSSRR